MNWGAGDTELQSLATRSRAGRREARRRHRTCPGAHSRLPAPRSPLSLRPQAARKTAVPAAWRTDRVADECEDDGFL